MIISRTPFRISFFGGGTDYPIHYEKRGGEVLSTTINHYLYLTVNQLSPFFDHRIHIGYSRSELVREVDEIEHPSVRCCLRHLGIESGIEIFVMADLPARTGLGSSSAFTVGLLNCLHAYQHKPAKKDSLAREAIYVEQQLIKERVGNQDQVATAFGGLNHIHFNPDSTFRVEPVQVLPERKELFQSHLMLFFTGISRAANDIAEEQCRREPINAPLLETMRGQVTEGVRILCESERNLQQFGHLLHEAWMLKRQLAPRISNSYIDDSYEMARKHGAIGGKILGAGGGGFLLLFVPPDRQEELRQSLPRLMHVPFCFEEEGTHLILQTSTLCPLAN